MFKIFTQTRRTIPLEIVLEIVHPASIVATVVSHGSETCPNMGDDGSVLEISSKWLEIPRMGRSSSFHVCFFCWVLILTFNWFWLIFLGDFPICPAFATHVPTLLKLVTTVTTHFRTINQWNQQSMVLKCFELSNLSDFWILIPIHRTSDPHRMERMQQIRLHLTMFDCVSLGRRRLVVDQRILRG